MSKASTICKQCDGERGYGKWFCSNCAELRRVARLKKYQKSSKKRAADARYYKKNKTSVLNKAKLYKEKNNDKIKKRRIDNRDQILLKQRQYVAKKKELGTFVYRKPKYDSTKRKRYSKYSKEWYKQQIKHLGRAYVIQQLVNCGFSRDVIKKYPDLLEIKKVSIQTKRELKKIKL